MDFLFGIFCFSLIGVPMIVSAGIAYGAGYANGWLRGFREARQALQEGQSLVE